MSKTEKILILENEIEARLIDELLKEKGIPHLIRSFHDSATTGCFSSIPAGAGLMLPKNTGMKFLRSTRRCRCLKGCITMRNLIRKTDPLPFFSFSS